MLREKMTDVLLLLNQQQTILHSYLNSGTRQQVRQVNRLIIIDRKAIRAQIFSETSAAHLANETDLLQFATYIPFKNVWIRIVIWITNKI